MRAERRLAYLSGNGIKPAEIAGCLRREPDAAIGRRGYIVRVRPRRDHVLLHLGLLCTGDRRPGIQRK